MTSLPNGDKINRAVQSFTLFTVVAVSCQLRNSPSMIFLEIPLGRQCCGEFVESFVGLEGYGEV